MLIACELIHALRNKTTERVGYLAMILDMSKAYDRIEWDFLEETMRKMGFNESWNSLIMNCVKTTPSLFLLMAFLDLDLLLKEVSNKGILCYHI